MPTFSWDQIHQWRLAQHHLIQRLKPENALQAVQTIGGLQAQLMSAAELSLAARVDDLHPNAVPTALWEQRTLVKTWAMRGTLHLLPVADFPTYIGAFKFYKRIESGSWQKYYGISTETAQAMIANMSALLSDQGITREELARRIAENLNLPHLQELILSGWGGMLKPVAFQGALCFGRSEGQRVTFLSPSAWIGEQLHRPTPEALAELARLYLHAYAPATTADFARWLGVYASDGKKILKTIADEIQEIQVEGFTGYILTADLPSLEALTPTETIRLLPYFDVYTISLSLQRAYLMDETYKAKVYRSQGWISPVILQNGRIIGVWDQEKKRDQLQLKIDLFSSSPHTEAIQAGIEAEAQRIGRFLQSSVELVYAS